MNLKIIKLRYNFNGDWNKHLNQEESEKMNIEKENVDREPTKVDAI